MLTRRQTRLLQYVEHYFRQHRPDAAHEIDHIQRVTFWAEKLARAEKADSEVVIAAAILHDIGMPKFGDARHATEGAKMAVPILKQSGYSASQIQSICSAIVHHTTEVNDPPRTLEEKVVFDADKLDAVGPISLHRWFFDYQKRGCLHAECIERTLVHLKRWKKTYGPGFSTLKPPAASASPDCIGFKPP